MRLRRYSQLVLVACLSVLAAPTAAHHDVPFRALIDTEINVDGECGPGCVVLGIGGTGNATHMGSLQIAGPSQIDFTSFRQSGVSTLTAANGDTLTISFAGTFTPEGPDPAGPVSFEAKPSTFVARFWSAVRAAVMSPDVSAVRSPADSCVSEAASSAVSAFEV